MVGISPYTGSNCTPKRRVCRKLRWIGSVSFSLTWSQLHGRVAYSQDTRGLGMLEGVEDGEGRAFLGRTHVGEHQAPPHFDRIGALAEPVTD